MRTSNDDMIEQLRRRKIPYNNELNNSIDYAIDCIKNRESLEITARKYRKLQAEYEKRLKADMVNMLTEIQTDINHGVGLPKDRIVSYADGVDNAVNIIQQKINVLENGGKE